MMPTPTSSSMHPLEFEQLFTQIQSHINRTADVNISSLHILQQINKYLFNQHDLDLPEISSTQIDQLLNLMNDCKLLSIINASNVLKKIRQIIETAKSSHYQININDVIYDLYRMPLQRFKRFLNDKKLASERQEYLE